MPTAMHDDRSAHGIALPLLLGALVTAVVAAAMLASPSPWLLAADTGNGFVGQTVPAYRAWLSGRVPEWTDLLWGGYPIVGDCSNAALYPPHVLAYLVTRDAPLRFFDAAFALHAGILAAGSAYLLAVLGAGRPAQCLAAALAALSPFTHYCAMVFFPVFAAQAWWPWALASAERLARPSTPWLGGAMVLGWIALAAQVLAGMPEQATYGAIVAAAWLLTRRAELPLPRRAARLVILGAGAAALAAPQLLPTTAYVRITERAARMDHTLSAAAALVPDDPSALLVAGAGVLHGVPSFLGIAVPVLVLAGVAMRRARALFLAIVALVAFAYASGATTPVYALLHRLPPLDHFRAPLKLEALVELALAWSAALGFDSLVRARAPWTRLAIGLAVLACGERAAYMPGELAAFGTLVERTGVPPTILEKLAASRPVQNKRPAWPPPQVLDINGPYGGGYARSLGPLVGMSSIRPYPVSLLSRAHLTVFASRPNRPALPALLGVQYMLVETRNCEKVARGARWPVVQRTDEYCIIENPKPSDRYTLLLDAKAVASEDEMLDAVLKQPEGRVPVVAPPDALAGLSNGYVWPAPLAEPGRGDMRVITAKGGLVLVRQSALPGWDVRVDGRPTASYPAAGIFFAVPVGPGVHQISLRYRTPGFRSGLAITAAWIVLAAATAVGLRLVRRAPSLTAPARS